MPDKSSKQTGFQKQQHIFLGLGHLKKGQKQIITDNCEYNADKLSNINIPVTLNIKVSFVNIS